MNDSGPTPAAPDDTSDMLLPDDLDALMIVSFAGEPFLVTRIEREEGRVTRVLFKPLGWKLTGQAGTHRVEWGGRHWDAFISRHSVVLSEAREGVSEPHSEPTDGG